MISLLVVWLRDSADMPKFNLYGRAAAKLMLFPMWVVASLEVAKVVPKRYET